MPKVSLKLICDNRERSLFDFLPESDDVIRAQMTTADYAFVSDDSVLEIFERKSLGDYADSFKDGRHENKNKLLSMRERTGCNIYYIVEGQEPEDHETKIHGIKYSSIEASMFNMMSNCGIFLIRTKSPEDTARVLLAKKKALTNSIKNGKFDERIPIESPVSLLCERSTLTFNQIICDMFEQIPGVSSVTAACLAENVRVSDVIFGANDLDDRLKMTVVNGRKLSKSKISKIIKLDSIELSQLFTAIPGIKNVEGVSDILEECPSYDTFIEKISTVYTKNKVEKIKKVLLHNYGE